MGRPEQDKRFQIFDVFGLTSPPNLRHGLALLRTRSSPGDQSRIRDSLGDSTSLFSAEFSFWDAGPHPSNAIDWESMSSVRLLVLGTRNRKKGQELGQLLAPSGFQLRTLADFDNSIEVVEDGDSFAANAERKATLQALHLRHWVLGEDSGLCVEALQGAPGIFSARYSGPAATDEKNNQRLIDELADIPLERRNAHYVCHMAVADPQGTIQANAEARCYGRIQLRPAGTGGFGYDPLFQVLEYHRTFGQLGGAVKAALSHRARAFRQLLPQLLRLVRKGNWQ